MKKFLYIAILSVAMFSCSTEPSLKEETKQSTTFSTEKTLTQTEADYFEIKENVEYNTGRRFTLYIECIEYNSAGGAHGYGHDANGVRYYFTLPKPSYDNGYRPIAKAYRDTLGGSCYGLL